MQRYRWQIDEFSTASCSFDRVYALSDQSWRTNVAATKWCCVTLCFGEEPTVVEAKAIIAQCSSQVVLILWETEVTEVLDKDTVTCNVFVILKLEC